MRGITALSTLELSAPTADDLGKCVSGLVNAVARGMEEQLEPWGLSALEFSILGMCLNARTTTVTKLAGMIPVDSGRISRIVNKFHKRGLIKRERMKSDRRVVKLQLSEKGLRLVPRLVHLVEDYNKMLLSGVTVEDLTRFVATSHTIMENYARHLVEVAGEREQDPTEPS